MICQDACCCCCWIPTLKESLSALWPRNISSSCTRTRITAYEYKHRWLYNLEDVLWYLTNQAPSRHPRKINRISSQACAGESSRAGTANVLRNALIWKFHHWRLVMTYQQDTLIKVKNTASDCSSSCTMSTTAGWYKTCNRIPSWEKYAKGMYVPASGLALGRFICTRQLPCKTPRPVHTGYLHHWQHGCAQWKKKSFLVKV